MSINCAQLTPQYVGVKCFDTLIECYMNTEFSITDYDIMVNKEIYMLIIVAYYIIDASLVFSKILRKTGYNNSTQQQQ